VRECKNIRIKISLVVLGFELMALCLLEPHPQLEQKPLHLLLNYQEAFSLSTAQKLQFVE
jgi:hypothetical protein